jgi:RNA polymerase sigma factor (sigma-70 family)
MQVLEKNVKRNVKGNFRELYEEAFPPCARWVHKMNGSLDDAQDLFQDALVIYIEKRNDLEFIDPVAYILGIVKHLWIRKFNKSKSFVSMNSFENTLSITENYYPSVSTVRLLNFLEVVGRQCLELLRGFYYENLSMKDLSVRMGYRSEHSVAAQKYKCIEKLRTSIKQKFLSYEDFLE